MKKNVAVVSVLFVGLLWIYSSGEGSKMQRAGGPDFSAKTQVVPPAGVLKPDLNFGKFPLYFISNNGQVNEKAKFYAKASRYTLWLTKEGLVFDAIKGGRGEPPLRDASGLMFIRSNMNPEIIPIEETKHRVNYFKGSDQSKWHCNVPTSRAVLYKALYKNIDLKVYGIEKQIEYDWIVKAGGNPDDIRFEYKNVKGTRIDEKGNLLIETRFGELMHKKPVSYQLVGAAPHDRSSHRACPEERTVVNVSFKKTGKNIYGFDVGEYDKNRELIIDPVVLAYSTYLGGNADDNGAGIAVDDNGYAYVCGRTLSTDFPTLNGYQADQPDYDAFILKIDTAQAGAAGLVYSTYLGGDNEDSGFGIAVEGSGNVYVTGHTVSTNFPILNQYQTNKAGNDVFVAKIDTTQAGAAGLVYSTYLGGNSVDVGTAIAVDGGRYAYVTGYTSSTNFPTVNPYRETYQGGGYDAFVTKIDTKKSGETSLIYSTYLGGNAYDIGAAIDVDGTGNVYLTGDTGSINFPTVKPYQSFFQGGIYDAFVTVIDTTKPGTPGLTYSTFLGGDDDDSGYGIAVDAAGFIYVTGKTYSSQFPTKNQYRLFQGETDAFLSKIDITPGGSSILIYSTYLGGTSWDHGEGVAVDSGGNAYITGNTISTDFPVLHPYQESFLGGNGTAFATRIDTTKTGVSSLIYSTYLGGTSSDYSGGIALDKSGNIYLTGTTYSTDFPVFNQYQANQSGSDVYFTKLVFYPDLPFIQLNRTALTFGAVLGEACTGSQSFTINKSGEGALNWTAAAAETWIQVSPSEGTNTGQVTVSLDTTGMSVGTHTGTISIADPGASNSPQTVSVTLNIYSSGGGPGSSTGPFGQFSTPLDGSAVSSSIPVTGWVLDDIEVESVKIYLHNDIYVGDALFVEGARPDIESAYPTYPFNYRAGWGYMLLTHFLPNGGNGTYTLHAVAVDKEGKTVTLGSKTIVCDNANAVKPFGAIDTPFQGGDAAGGSYRNNGWVLTPLPNKIPTDGSTIFVYVDGVKLGNVKYNIYREDIAGFFPGYANSDGAAGYFDLDTTAFADGVHTISWSAVDNAGNTDGIGSRYFSVQNSVQRSSANCHWSLGKGDLSEIPFDGSTPVWVKRGHNPQADPVEFYLDDNGITTVKINELERVEIRLVPGPAKGLAHLYSMPVETSMKYTGYQIAGNRLKPLPIGSTLDTEHGIFYWQPGPGFIGEYRFVFLEKGINGDYYKKYINIVIR